MDEFIAGTNVDAVRDTDWVFISGPSLIRTDRDAIFVHYSTTDAKVDHAIDIVAHKYDRGGYFDAGVPGVKGDDGSRRSRATRLLATANASARRRSAGLRAHRGDDALEGENFAAHSGPAKRCGSRSKIRRTRCRSCRRRWKELRLWITPRRRWRRGCDRRSGLHDAAAAIQAAEDMKKLIRQQNSLGVRMLTNGLLNGFDVAVDGSTVRGRLPASKEQLQTLLGLVASQLGVSLPETTTPQH